MYLNKVICLWRDWKTSCTHLSQDSSLVSCTIFNLSPITCLSWILPRRPASWPNLATGSWFAVQPQSIVWQRVACCLLFGHSTEGVCTPIRGSISYPQNSSAFVFRVSRSSALPARYSAVRWSAPGAMLVLSLWPISGFCWSPRPSALSKLPPVANPYRTVSWKVFPSCTQSDVFFSRFNTYF